MTDQHSSPDQSTPVIAAALTVDVESWPLKKPFSISRGSKTKADVIVVRASNSQSTGHGEAVPYARYSETLSEACKAIDSLQLPLDRKGLQNLLPAGAARNAVDCALWDLETKCTGTSIEHCLGVAPMKPVETAFTISLASPEEMAADATAVPNLKLLKLKLGRPGDHDRMAAVRAARPDARLIVDANEAWPATDLANLIAAAANSCISLIEQPLPADADDLLTGLNSPIPICADESARTSKTLPELTGRYQAVNIKLDKTGGLSDALLMAEAARNSGLQIMVGCMVATSLAMAPAMVLAQQADWVDLDGPLLLKTDRPHALQEDNGWISPPTGKLWGAPV